MENLEFLCTSAFLSTEIDARAIKGAMDLGILDALEVNGATSLTQMSVERRVNPRGLQLLVDMLEVNGVVVRTDDRIGLTDEFRKALGFRDLLMSRIEFADLVWSDIHKLFIPLLTDLPQFMARSKVFDLFRYDRCYDITPENLEATRAWTRFTTCLTKYEAGVAWDAVDLEFARSFIDLGGNTGEFALQACRRSPKLTATVVDLPVVCEIGRRHISDVGESDAARRIAFFPTDMRTGALPDPADLVSFKSVLHDWPDEDAVRLLERARQLVRPGGRLLIFEREPISVRGRRISYAITPDLAFLHFLRPADLYLKKLAELGFDEIEHRRIALDVGFHLITARRPPEPGAPQSQNG
jgi:SAM-dependent methyltransferase